MNNIILAHTKQIIPIPVLDDRRDCKEAFEEEQAKESSTEEGHREGQAKRAHLQRTISIEECHKACYEEYTSCSRPKHERTYRSKARKSGHGVVRPA